MKQTFNTLLQPCSYDPVAYSGLLSTSAAILKAREVLAVRRLPIRDDLVELVLKKRLTQASGYDSANTTNNRHRRELLQKHHISDREDLLPFIVGKGHKHCFCSFFVSLVPFAFVYCSSVYEYALMSLTNCLLFRCFLHFRGWRHKVCFAESDMHLLESGSHGSSYGQQTKQSARIPNRATGG